MDAATEFDRYIAHLSDALGYADRRTGLTGYCPSLMLPLSNKRVDPMAACVDPLRASARHKALHHFVAKAQWTARAVLSEGWLQSVMPILRVSAVVASRRSRFSAASGSFGP